MANLNKAQIIGHVGRDPEVRSFTNGDRVANVSVATTEKWKDKQSGEAREATEWHRIVFTGRLAEIVEQYVRRGSLIYIEGKLRTRKYADASNIERYATEIRADQMQLLGGRQGSGEQDGAPRQQQAPRQANNAYQEASGGGHRQAPLTAPSGASSGFDDMDDDIPF